MIAEILRFSKLSLNSACKCEQISKVFFSLLFQLVETQWMPEALLFWWHFSGDNGNERIAETASFPVYSIYILI